jgi:prepilin-type N-terminal cleavage/methylation domain-containing protein
MKILVKNQGQSLIEVIIAMAIFGLVAAALMGFVLNGDQALRQGGEQAQAEALAQEGMEAVKSIRDNSWNNLTVITSTIIASTSQWVFGNEGDIQNIGKYTRSIKFADVCRDGTGQITGQAAPTFASGSTVNSTFDGTSEPWRYYSWGETPPAGNFVNTLLNPDDYVEINFGSAKSTSGGGYWQQSFTIDDENLVSMNIDFEWNVSWFWWTPNSLQVYAYLEKSPGAPQSSPVWSSGEITGSRSWAQIPATNVKDKFTGPGTYYFKIAAYVIYPSSANGNYTIGIDNAILKWQAYHKDPSYCPNNSYEDVQSKIATVNVSWPVRDGVTNSVEKTSILTNWHSRDWTQNDWSLGPGQDNWSDPKKYNSNYNIKDDIPNQVSLAPLSGFGTTTWPFDVATDYNYDHNKIEVKYSFAQLLGTEHIDAGATTNPDCNADLTGAWKQADVEDPSPGKVSETWIPLVGGNLGSFINVQITGGEKNKDIIPRSGMWYQSFSPVANPDTATVSFDWKITSYQSTCLGSFFIYVFVDSSLNNTNFDNNSWVWRQAINSVSSGWNVVLPIEVKDKITTGGPYYLKLVARRINANKNACTNTAGFDNIQLNWSKTTIVYPSDLATTSPVVSSAPANLIKWTGFEETANKNGGLINYQLSFDNGVHWYYWNTSNWVVAGATNYNDALTINNHIGTFPNAAGRIMFKAFLKGNGTNQVQLGEIRIGYLASGGLGYKTYGYLVSSAFDTKSTSSFQAVEWDQNSLCTDCSIKLYVQAAPDNNGSPGVWTDWYGYFSKYQGNMIINTINGNRWVRYRAELYGNSSETPVLTGARINYR